MAYHIPALPKPITEASTLDVPPAGDGYASSRIAEVLPRRTNPTSNPNGEPIFRSVSNVGLPTPRSKSMSTRGEIFKTFVA